MAHINKNILLLSTADWDNPFWTNKQHVATELSKLGYNVLYIDSLGLRSPSLNKSDIARILRRFIKGLRPPRKVAKSLWVWSPIVLPFQKYGLVRLFNKLLLSFSSRLFTLFLGFDNPIIWTYNPMTLGLFSVSQKSLLIYHCVDEIKQQPGMPVFEIEEAEKQLLKRADIVFVTSQTLYETRCKMNPSTFLFSNVADYDHFSKARDNLTVVPNDIAAIKSPVIGFVGAISSYKLDFDLVAYIAQRRPDWSIVLIGKVGEGEPGTDASRLDCKNVHLIGARSYELLPAYIKHFDVAVIPVMLNDYTHAMFPMKFFEYLAAGKRVVSTRIHSLLEYEPYVELAKSPDDFIEKIDMILADKADDGMEKRLTLAQQNTYETRMKKMLTVIEKNLDGRQ